MSHGPTIDLGHDQPPLPNEHFSSWLRGQTTLFISQIVAILGSISLVASTIYYVSHLGGENEKFTLLTVTLIVDFAHLAFIAVFILFLIQVLDDNERGSYRVRRVYERVFKKPKGSEENVKALLENGKDRLRKFKKRFLWFWIGMLCLYLSFAFHHGYEASLEHREESAFSADFSFSLSGKSPEAAEEKLKIGLSLSASSESQASAPKDHHPPSQQSPKEKPPRQPLNDEQMRKQLFFPFLELFFNNLTLMFVFWCFLIMYVRPGSVATDRWYKVGSGVVIAALTFLFCWLLRFKKGGFTADELRAYTSIFDALSGVANAVVLALLIARLDSKLVGLPSWLISILYSYAAVQPLFLVFELGPSPVLKKIATLVLIFVFVSKIYFFLIIFYALQTGKMLNYLTCFPVLRNRADFPDPWEQGTDGKCASVFWQLAKLPPRGARRLAKLRWHAYSRQRRLPARPLRARLSEARGRLGRATSALLMSPRCLYVGEFFGWVGIAFFFTFMVGSQVFPEVIPLVARAQESADGIDPSALPQPGSGAVAVAAVHLAVVFLLIVILLLAWKENGNGRDIVPGIAESIFGKQLEHGHLLEESEAQLKNFKRYFLYFWVVTCLLYIVFLLQHWFPPPQSVYGPYLREDAAKVVNQLFYPALEFLLASLNLMCAFWCFVVLQSPAFAKLPGARRKHSEARKERFEARQKLLINYSSFVVMLLIAAYLLLLLVLGRTGLSPEDLKDYATVFDGATGMLSAVVLALLIARTNSKLFSLKSRLIWMLFVYASIQSLFIAFAQTNPVLQTVRTLVLASTLGLKICFFLVIIHSLQSGKVLNYLVCFPLLKERVDSIFENQFEIKLTQIEEHEFTFSILKKNRLHYSTAMKFKNRKECDRAVERLRGLMGRSKPYGQPREASGTYWLEVKSSGELLCESIPLRSHEEALDLMDESMSKVPYCKYNRL